LAGITGFEPMGPLSGNPASQELRNAVQNTELSSGGQPLSVLKTTTNFTALAFLVLSNPKRQIIGTS
jgi:hypothetical protein